MATPLLALTPAERQGSNLDLMQQNVLEELKGVESRAGPADVGQFNPSQEDMLIKKVDAYNRQGSPYLDAH